MFIAALISIVRKWNQPRCPTDNWRKQIQYMCTTEYYAAIKENEITTSSGKCMQLETVILSEINLSQEYKTIFSHMGSVCVYV